MPAAQRLAPAGIDGHADSVGEVDLFRLSRLPPFQAFIAQQEPLPPGMQADKFALERARAGGKALLASYAAWHQAQAKWPHEDPFTGYPSRI